jgi:hypothetical protein
VTIGVSNEIGDSSADCQSYVAFVIEVVGTLDLIIDPNITWNEITLLDAVPEFAGTDRGSVAPRFSQYGRGALPQSNNEFRDALDADPGISPARILRIVR